MKIAVLVSNDLSHDQRVRKQCDVLIGLGHELTLVGRMMKGSIDFERPYTIKRFRLPFNGGMLFYAALNVRLFFFLLFHPCEGILCNDLDTLPAGYLVARLRKKKLVYDSHEYFTESAGLTGRPFPTKAWTIIEEWIFPKLKTVYTVNASFAERYNKKYNKAIGVVRNIPPMRKNEMGLTKSDLGLPEDKKVVLLQGAYIDIDRGAKELAQAVAQMEGVLLLVIGAGAEWEWVNDFSKTDAANKRVIVHPKMPYEQLARYTQVADVGCSLDKPIHGNYIFSLPNKLFDYIQARVPVLASDLVELRKIIDAYHVGQVVEEVSIEGIKNGLTTLLSKPKSDWNSALKIAAEELNWERESAILSGILKDGFA